MNSFITTVTGGGFTVYFDGAGVDQDNRLFLFFVLCFLLFALKSLSINKKDIRRDINDLRYLDHKVFHQSLVHTCTDIPR